MSEKLRRAILGYLIVLNDETALGILSEEERRVGHQSIMGSLCFLDDELSKIDTDEARRLRQSVRERETENGKTVGESKSRLQQLTETCAQGVVAYLRGNDPSR